MNRGFTLIELLMTMAVLGALAGLVLLGYGSQIDRANDTERRSDIKQYQTALEAYANSQGGVYPIYPGSGVDIASLCGSSNELGAIACQDDPESSQSYIYSSDSRGYNYVLYARLEKVDGYYVVCSNGEVGEKASASWVVPTNGACPTGLVAALIPGQETATVAPAPTTAPTTAPTATPTPTPTITPSIPGLAGIYYNNENFTGSTATRTDTTINFDWSRNQPHPAIGDEEFSIRWTGYLTVPTTGNYRFYTQSDDGVRLYVNNALIVSNWSIHSVTENSSSTIALQQGTKYPITLEFYDHHDHAVIRMLWEGPSISKQIVPSTVLSVN